MSTHPLGLDLSRIPNAAERASNKKLIEEVEKQLEEYRQKVAELEKELHMRKAYGAPIRMLNEDIIPIISRHATLFDPAITLKMARVCRFWRRALINAPHAWSHITLRDGGYTKALLNRYLERSKNALLDISFATSSPNNWEHFREKLLEDAQSRVKALYIQFYLGHRLPAFLPPSKFLLLTTMSLESNSESSLTLLLENHRHEVFPKLRTLHLNTWTINECLPLFSNLHELRLVECSIPIFNSFIDLFRYTLLSLEVTGCSFTFLGQIQGELSNVWDLPNLRNLVLGSKGYPTTAIPQINCPRLNRLELSNIRHPHFPYGMPPHIREFKFWYWENENERQLVDALLAEQGLKQVTVVGKVDIFLRDLVHKPSMISPTVKILELERGYAEVVTAAKVEHMVGELKNTNLKIVLLPTHHGERQQTFHTITA